MDHVPKYLYCIIRGSEERTFEGVSPIGDSHGPVDTVPYDGLAAVVSDSPAREYESTRANMLAHQQVQERIMRDFTLLPVRFGTVAHGVSPIQDLQRLLEKRRREFDQLLAEMEGRIELGLKALWKDQQAVFGEILAHNAPIRGLRDSLQDRPPQATHFDRLRLGEMVKRELDQKRKAEAADLLTPLRQLARRTVENDTVGDRMIVNTAFLADRCREAEFDQAVGQLVERLGQRINFKYVGPVPPYNFVNITVNWSEL